MNNLLYKAIFKSVFGRMSAYVVQFASLAIYARLFSPEEFGIIASIQVFVIFFQLLADVGFGPAIINEERFEKNKRDGVFSVTVLLGFLLALLFYYFSYVLNDFYGGFEYQSVAKFVCVGVFFNTLNIIPTTAMNKDTKFYHLSSIEICSEVLSLLIVYFLYLNNFGLYALASKVAVQSSTKFLLTWFFSVKTELGRPVLGRELYHIKMILKFSLYQFGFNFINYFSRNLDNVLIAKYFGMSSIGIYEKSYQLMRYPLMITTFAMTPAIQPILVKLKHNRKKIVEEHNLLTARLLAISLPIAVFMYLNSYSIVVILFGGKWLEVEGLIKVFSLIIPIQAVLSTSGSFFQVINKPNLLFFSGLLSAVVNVIAIVSGIIFGEVIYVAYGLVISFAFNFFQAYFVLFRYGFEQPSDRFYQGLLKSIFIISPSIFLYILLKLFLLDELYFNAISDLVWNSIAGIASLLFFIKLIKKLV